MIEVSKMVLDNSHAPSAPTMEFGPQLDQPAPEFTAQDHMRRPYHLNDLIGERGLVLGFIGDVWQQVSIQRIFWLDRHAHTFIKDGIKVALLIRDEPHMVYGFHASSSTQVEFPLLADARGDIHSRFNMSAHPGLVLIDGSGIVRQKWLVPDDRIWPKIGDMLDALHSI
jgi:alkyl hydroperoxide reductase subunit AhpC